ncbi:MAG: Uma2 family endonuclease [Lachnospiraceae bacterium]|nr:Uma2 family endonuclease [Lachnospiraceae bacterium]
MPKEHTIEDIYNLPEGQRAELIDGQMYMMAPSNTRHQELVFALSREIADYIDSRNGTCKVYISPFAVFLNNNKNYVEPDISVICDKNKIDENGCNGAPDWIIEIVSPSSRHMDYMTKLFKYRTAGVREYWIVDHVKDRILVYKFEQDTMSDYSFKDIIKTGIYSDLEIDFSEIV